MLLIASSVQSTYYLFVLAQDISVVLFSHFVLTVFWNSLKICQVLYLVLFPPLLLELLMWEFLTCCWIKTVSWKISTFISFIVLRELVRNTTTWLPEIIVPEKQTQKLRKSAKSWENQLNLGLFFRKYYFRFNSLFSQEFRHNF